MPSPEDLKKYFPSFLTDAEQQKLKEALRNYNESRSVSNILTAPGVDYLQGDFVGGIPMYDYGSHQLLEATRCIIVSNSCDIDPSNDRPNLPIDCVVAPILNLDKVFNGLTDNGKRDLSRVNVFIENIKNNRLTNVFYVPLAGSERGFAAFFDKSFSFPSSVLSTKGIRIKSLTLFGFYFFIFKLSVNFCRMHDNVHRDLESVT